MLELPKDGKIKWQYEIAAKIIDDKRNLIVTDKEIRLKTQLKNNREVILNQKYYKYHCLKCGWTDGCILESKLKSGHGCSCCSGRSIVAGINDLPTKYPDILNHIVDKEKVYALKTGDRTLFKCPVCGTEKPMLVGNWLQYGLSCDYCKSVAAKSPETVKYFENKEDAYKYSYNSPAKVKFKCPECGHTKSSPVYNIVNYGFSCVNCSDGYSYPEKFMLALLRQLKIKVITQLSKTYFDWCGAYYYDFYLPDFNCIIETHGLQHYSDRHFNHTSKKITISQAEKDKLKESLALENNIQHYIVIDCRYSNTDWVSKSILNSDLANLLDLTSVDWSLCNVQVQKTLVKEVCDCWNVYGGTKTASELSNLLGLNRTTIVKYLKIGTKAGWCTYCAKEELSKRSIKAGKKNANEIAVYKGNDYLFNYESGTALAKHSLELLGIDIKEGRINSICLGKVKSGAYKGFRFEYV